MQKKKRQLLNLAIGELIACLSFLFAFVMLNPIFDLGRASLIILTFLISQLIQGGIYWIIRYRSLKRRKPIITRTIFLYALLRKINLLLCFGIPVLAFFLFENNLDLLFGVGIYIFALIEYINYYWFRLSYGKSGFNIRKLIRTGFRRSSLHKLIKNHCR